MRHAGAYLSPPPLDEGLRAIAFSLAPVLRSGLTLTSDHSHFLGPGSFRFVIRSESGHVKPP